MKSLSKGSHKPNYVSLKMKSLSKGFRYSMPTRNTMGSIRYSRTFSRGIPLNTLSQSDQQNPQTFWRLFDINEKVSTKRDQICYGFVKETLFGIN